MIAPGTYRRDALLAGGALAGLVTAGLLLADGTLFLRPAAVALGVGGALLVETAFLRYPEGLLAVWKCPGVALFGVGTVLLVGVVAARYAPWVLGAVCWGLVTYLALLGCLLAGVGNPVAAVVTPDDGEPR